MKKLRQAVNTLQIFSSKKTKSSLSRKIMALMRDFFGSGQECDSDINVRDAVNVIQQQRLLIPRLQNGSPEDQELAQKVNEAVAAYNKAYKNKTLPNIELPRSPTVRQGYLGRSHKQPTKHTFFSNELSLNPQMTELFHMKVIALLEHYGIASNSQARGPVKQTPILSSAEKNESKYTLKQTFSLFPGQVITIIGSAALDPTTQMVTQLFPDTFSIFLESTQTGFPDPLQSTGWALGSPLIPECPQSIELFTKETANLFLNKKEIAEGLQPGGKWVGAARRLLQLKHQAFIQHQAELLTLHRTLATALLVNPKQRQISLIDAYFDEISKTRSPFEALTQTYQSIRDYYLTAPYQRFLALVLNWENIDLNHIEFIHRYGAVKVMLDRAFITIPKEKKSNRSLYIELIGRSIATHSKAIILQYLSEDLMFSPPMLNIHERRLQAIAYRQLNEFLNELKIPPKSIAEAYLGLKSGLTQDIFLLKQKSHLPINKELALYYKPKK